MPININPLIHHNQILNSEKNIMINIYDKYGHFNFNKIIIRTNSKELRSSR